MKSKINVQIAGVKLQLPESVIRRTDWRGNPITPYITIGAVEAASLIKQYVKKKYPNVVVNVKSQSYSGGCSCDVYLSDEYGYRISENIYKDVELFSNKFRAGRFDGMTDCYEYNSVDPTSDSGTKLSMSCKYVFVNNRPKFGSAPDIIRSIREHMAGEYLCGVQTFEGAKAEIAHYYKPKQIESAIAGVDLSMALKS